MKKQPLYIGGQEVLTEKTVPVYNKETNEVIREIAVAGEAECQAAVDAAEKAFHEVKLSAYERYEIILRAANLMRERTEEFASALSAEVGKPLRDARGEIGRAYQTLLLSAEEAKRLKGETIPLAGAPGCQHKLAFTIRQPLGVVCAITPFNFPVNLAAHKIGPVLAAGNTVIYKPASATPLTGALVGKSLTKDARIRMFSFTGSVPVGKSLQEAAGFRRVALELGSNSANVVHEDVKDVKKVAELCAKCAFLNAGQVCISCQRVYVSRSIYQEFCDYAVAFAKTFKGGKLSDDTTCLGPMIAEKEAIRIEGWVNDATAAGARVLTGGHRHGSFYEPTILTDVIPDMDIVKNETFAPVFSIIPYDTIEEAIAGVNNSRYGLQAGVFTTSLYIAHYAAEHIEADGVIINDGSSFRMDNMPYGGVKDSGMGKEGPEYAIRELTEEKTIIMNFD